MPLEVPKLRVFISWAGQHAETLGNAFHTHLPDVVNTIQPFMSGVNIDKGTRWGEVLSASLQDSSCAIVCLTPESIRSIWVAFEAGAVSRAAGGPDGARARIWTYLFGLEKKDLQLTPFAEYQATGANEEETYQLVRSINALCPEPVSAETLKRRFDNVFWPNFSKALAVAPDANPEEPSVSTGPAEPDLLAEILRTVRSVQRDLRMRQVAGDTTGSPIPFSKLMNKGKLAADIAKLELSKRGIPDATVTPSVLESGNIVLYGPFGTIVMRPGDVDRLLASETLIDQYLGPIGPIGPSTS